MRTAPMWCRKARSISRRTRTAVAPTVAARGALIGEFALLTETKRPVTAVAREPSSVVRIPRQLFLKTLEGYPDAAVRMRDALAARVNQHRRRIRPGAHGAGGRYARAQVNRDPRSRPRCAGSRRKSRRTSSAP